MEAGKLKDIGFAAGAALRTPVHTAGPWHALQGPGDNEWKLETTWHGGTAGIYLGRFTASLKSPADGVADANLICAAPDLLEALKYARAALDSYKTTGVGIHYEAIRRADAAIARATKGA